MLCRLVRNRLPRASYSNIRPNIKQWYSPLRLTDNVLIAEDSSKAVVTINCPKVLNSLNVETIKSIYDHLKDFQKSKTLVIMKGECNRSYGIGGDIESMIRYGLSEAKNCFREVYRMNYLIQNFKIPFIAFLDGPAIGSGIGLFIHGKYRIATERASLALMETSIGMFPHAGILHFLSRLTGKLGMYLCMTGHVLSGKDLVSSGIATHYCKSLHLQMLESRLLRCYDPHHIDDIVANTTMVVKDECSLTPYYNQINLCFNARTVEEIFQNLERDGSDWAKTTLATLKQMSPMSLKITHRALEEASRLSLAENLQMEFRMISRLDKTNVREGIRSIIVKDIDPHWKPANIEGVSDDQLAIFFNKLPDTEELNVHAKTK